MERPLADGAGPLAAQHGRLSLAAASVRRRRGARPAADHQRRRACLDGVERATAAAPRDTDAAYRDVDGDRDGDRHAAPNQRAHCYAEAQARAEDAATSACAATAAACAAAADEFWRRQYHHWGRPLLAVLRDANTHAADTYAHGDRYADRDGYQRGDIHRYRDVNGYRDEYSDGNRDRDGNGDGARWRRLRRPDDAFGLRAMPLHGGQ